jgi:inner membrane protein
MDNLTHTLAGALLGQMGLKRLSRFGMASCILGANAPDIDVIAPFFLPVDNIAFHRGPTHAIFGLPFMAAGVVALLWLVDRLKPRGEGALPFRPGPLFLVALLAVASHPFLDWLTTYAVALFAPLGDRWYSANAIFIIDWVYWLVLGTGLVWSGRRWRKELPRPERPARLMGLVLLAYIAGNIAWSQVAERRTAATLRQRGIEPELIVPSPAPIAFWNRAVAWRSDRQWGGGTFGPEGLVLDPATRPLNLDHPALLRARREQRVVRSFLYWSRMPIVVEEGGRPMLSDQRYYGPIRAASIPPGIRSAARRGGGFLVPLDTLGKP